MGILLCWYNKECIYSWERLINVDVSKYIGLVVVVVVVYIYIWEKDENIIHEWE